MKTCVVCKGVVEGHRDYSQVCEECFTELLKEKLDNEND